MTVDDGVLFTIGGAVVSGLAWLFREKGRIDVHEEKHRQHDKHHDQVEDDLRYIRDRVDEIVDKM